MQPNSDTSGVPQQKKATSPLVIVLAIIGGVMLLTVGSCFVCAGIGVAGAAKGISQAGKRGTSTSGENHAGPTTDESPRPTPTDVELKVLLAAYKANEIRADGQFKDRWVRTTGTVGAVKKGMLDEMFVTVGTGSPFEIPTIQCFLTTSQEAAAAQLNKGAKVTVVGRVSGLMMNVLVKDCEIQ